MRDWPDGHAGIQGTHAVLKDHLDVGPDRIQRSDRELGQILNFIWARVQHRTPGWCIELENTPGQRGFAAAAFSHNPQSLLQPSG